jgi:formylmethanofuran dehydrogenase subunit E
MDSDESEARLARTICRQWRAHTPRITPGAKRSMDPEYRIQSMESFNELLAMAEAAHGHLCAGQILGVRMAMLGCQRLGIDEPRGRDRKRLVTFVEIDRCATDAIGVVTGCRLGKRALKFRDWGKMAATFIDLPSDHAIRIAARESSKELARALHPEIDNKNQQQMLAYREMSDADLFTEEWVRVTLPPKEFPGYKGARLACTQCGEGINYDRFVEQDGRRLCLACANPQARYYQPL